MVLKIEWFRFNGKYKLCIIDTPYDQLMIRSINHTHLESESLPEEELEDEECCALLDLLLPHSFSLLPFLSRLEWLWLSDLLVESVLTDFGILLSVLVPLEDSLPHLFFDFLSSKLIFVVPVRSSSSLDEPISLKILSFFFGDFFFFTVFLIGLLLHLFSLCSLWLHSASSAAVLNKN